MQSKGFKTIKVEDAVGTLLAHDITEVRPGEYKGPSFRKGHEVRENDICHLMRLGKRHLYVLELKEGDVHEDQAVLELAEALAGPGVTFKSEPREGKIQLEAAHAGLFKAAVEPLIQLNLIPDVMCAAIHTNTPVKKSSPLAGTRAIPLVIKRDQLDRAVSLAKSHHPIFQVKPFKPMRGRLVITGNEVYEGLIKDKFEVLVRKKLQAYGATLEEAVILPDNVEKISQAVEKALKDDTDLIITTGGMSVDPDDVTRIGIQLAGVTEIYYGAAVLPGAMFQLAYKNSIPIMGIPACALYHPTTIFDLILPRLLAEEKPTAIDLATLAHGGLCLDCDICRYPSCNFGKTSSIVTSQ